MNWTPENDPTLDRLRSAVRVLLERLLYLDNEDHEVDCKGHICCFHSCAATCPECTKLRSLQDKARDLLEEIGNELEKLS